MIAALVMGAAIAWQPTDADYIALKRAALAGNFPIHYVEKKSSAMPRYDRIVFYPGPADPRYIWVNDAYASSPDRARYVNRALTLAAMDFGSAGDQWKRYYDDLVAQDDAQRAPVTDPYHYRHAFLDAMGAKLQALAPAVPAERIDPSIDAAAARVSDRDLGLVTNGYIATPVAAEVASLPADVLARYAGPRTKNKYTVYIVDRSSQIDDYEFYTDRTPPGSDDAVRGAFFEAIVDSGAAGPDLKASYDAAADKTRFGLIFARAFDLQNDRLEKAGREQVAWIFKTLRAGMSRERVSALLRSHGLQIDPKPRVDVLEFPIHSSIVCGTSVPVAFTFDPNGRLTQIEQQPDHSTCI